MTDHIWTHERIAAFLADGLDAIERERFDAHVRDCSECFSALEAARAFDGGLANLFASVRPSAMLEDRTLRAIREPKAVPARPMSRWGRRALMGLAATLVIGAFGAVTSFVIANGGLPMPGESFAWGTGPNSPLPERTRGVLRFGGGDDDEGTVPTAGEMAENLQRSLHRKFAIEDQAVDVKSTNGVASTSSNWYSTFGDQTFDAGVVDSTASPKTWDRRSGGQPNDQFSLQIDQPEEAGKARSKLTNRYYNERGAEADGVSLRYSNVSPPMAGPATAGAPMSGSGGAPGAGGVMFGGIMPPGGGPMGPGNATSTTTSPTGAYGFGRGGAPAPGLPQLQTNGGDVANRALGVTPTASTPAPPVAYFVPGPQGNVKENRESRDKAAEAIDSKKKLDDLAEREFKQRGFNGEAKPGDPKPEPKTTVGQTVPAPAVAPAVQQPAVRKIIIRSGDIEFEVESFDSAVATVTLLVTKIPNAYVGTVNSEKLANGKVKGSVVVRVPPDNLDGFVLELRKELGKTGELKGQRIGSQDITKMYTDLESRLKAARAMETRLLAIIKDGKGEIKQLLEAEKELGVWRTKIEEYEGELRYYGSLASLSTLTITMAEKEIRQAAGITENERVQAGIETEDVDKTFRDAMAAVLEAKGRVTKSELKQLQAGQYSAVLNFEVSPDASGPIRDRLKQLGRVARLEIDRQQTADGSPTTKDAKVKRGDTVFLVQFYNLANVAPRETAVVQVAVPDVAASFRTLRDAVEKAKGRVVTANVTEGEKINVTAQFDFEVKRTEEATLLAAIAAAGETVGKTVSRAPESDSVTDTKVLFRTSLFSAAKIPARETTVLQLSVTDVPATFTSLQDAAQKAGARIVNAQLHDGDGNQITQLDFELKRGAEAPVLALFATAGDTVYRNVLRAAETAQATDSKVLYRLSLLEASKMQPRETTTVQYAVTDIPAGFRALKDAVEKAKGRIVNSSLNENDKLNVTAQLDFELKRGEDGPVLAAMAAEGDVLGRQTTRQPESRLVSDSKALYRVTFANANRLKPRETTTLAIEVDNVDTTAAALSAFVTEAKGRIVDSNVANDRSGRVTAKLVYDVPLASAAGIVEKAKGVGIVRVQQTGRDQSATDGKFATARLDIVLSNADLIVPSDSGVWPQVRKGLATSASVLLSSLTWVIFGLCVVLPWMVVGYFGYRLVRRATKRSEPMATPATTG
ncbi:MAG: DUF4349 domain-containing protein [Gemmataceae bacterium]|nr:DUF4349 domain-containing protein [Gemmataceae bacterium]